MTTQAPDGEEDAMMVAFGARVRQLRKERHPSQEAFAASTGMSQKYVSRVESGLQNLNLRSISRIALAFGMTMSELLAGIEADPGSAPIRPYRRQQDQ